VRYSSDDQSRSVAQGAAQGIPGGAIVDRQLIRVGKVRRASVEVVDVHEDVSLVLQCGADGSIVEQIDGTDARRGFVEGILRNDPAANAAKRRAVLH
jgi:hypothetical protein